MRTSKGMWLKAVWPIIAAVICGARIFAESYGHSFGDRHTPSGDGAFGPSIMVEAGKEKLLFDCGRGAT
jgi:hypothetical protein